MGILKIQKNIGKILKQLRQSRSLTQEDVAFSVDISRDHLSNIENGKYPINIKTLYKLACFYDAEMKDFF